MRKVFLILFFVCEIVFARDIIAVSIPMQKEFVQKIAGDDYKIVQMVEQGVNPHDFEPKISDVKMVNKAVAYFSIGIEFEEVWLPRFENQNKNMRIFANDSGIKKINFAHSHSHDTHSKAHHENGDTHIWLSARNAKIIAENIYKALKELNKNADYAESYANLMAEITQLDRELNEILEPLTHQKFVVFHPMLGYFANDYHLEEISIEIEGKSPKMKDMIEVIGTIKKEKLKVVFAQPEFSTKSAEFIAKESGAKLRYFSPLQTPWATNLLSFAKTLAELSELP